MPIVIINIAIGIFTLNVNNYNLSKIKSKKLQITVLDHNLFIFLFSIMF